MEDQPLNFRPLTFSQTLHNKLKPPMFDGNFTHGEHYVSGKLKSLQLAKDALLFVAEFIPGPDAKSVGWTSPTGEVEFLLMKRKGRYLGTITRQNPEHFLRFSNGEKVDVLDGLGHSGSGLGGRQGAHFWCSLHSPKVSSHVSVTVSVYIGLGWLGAWKEIVVKLPKKELYVAHP